MDPILVFDNIGNTSGQLTAVTINNGEAIFDYYNIKRLPYISLPVVSLGPGKIVTVEVWAKFKSTNDPRSTLFSFGDRLLRHNFTALAEFTKEGIIYLTYIYNPLKGYTKSYINGGFSSYSTIAKVPLYEPNYDEHFAYIGRNAAGTGPGMTAKIDEFRVYEGELSESTIRSHYIIGADPSHVSLSSKLTTGNVNVTFLTISKQFLKVSFTGGESQVPMFGSDTLFDFASSDSKCGFKVTLPLNSETSSATSKLPAMNYTVTLSDASRGVPAPQFASLDCDYLNPNTRCRCAPSKTPYSYLDSSNALTQYLTVTEVNQSTVGVNFKYHSGVCMEVLGTELFPVNDGNTSITEGLSCFPDTPSFLRNTPSSRPLVLSEGDSKTLTLILFERYPEGYKSDSYINDYNVSSSSISVMDPASGLKSALDLSYNSSIVNSTPTGVNYSMHIGNPSPISRFSFPLQVTVIRKGPEGYSTVYMMWYILVTGVISNEIPNFIPVSSDPTLIFYILRDPPGGGSSATLSAGTSIDFGMAVENMYAYDGQLGSNIATSAGISGQFNSIVGFGVQAESPVAGLHADISTESNKGHSISSSKGSDTSYDYSISFDYAISTSSDPFTAGHASDIIVGGGVDLIVSEGIAGSYYSLLC